VQRRCARRVRPVRAEREVPRAMLRIPNELSEATMEDPPRSRDETLIRDGREQWMRESDPAMLEREHAVRERGLEQLLLDEVQRRLGESGDGCERLLRLGRKALEAFGEQALELARDRQLVGRRENAAPRPQRLCKLEREERIAARLVVDAAQDRPRERGVEPFLQQPWDGAEAQRAEREPLAGNCARDLVAEGGVAPRALGHDDAQRLVREPTKSERKRGRGGRIDPLDVVDS